MDLITITGALSGLKNAYDLAKTAIAARDEAKITAAHQALTDRIIDVQNAALSLQEKQSAARDEIDSLKEDLRIARAKIAELEGAQTERAKYVLHDVGRGAWVYATVASSRPEEHDGHAGPSHYICQPCFDGPEKRKSVLQYTPGSGDRTRYRVSPFWTCPVCKYVVSER